MSDPVHAQIAEIIAQHHVVLFMKGTPDQPQCGFSATAAGILHELDVDFHGVNVLADPGIRSGIKSFSQWPTIPQLYIGKEFVGGSDIVKQMSENGELHEMLGLEYVEPTAPTITITDAMKEAIESAGTGPGEYARFVVSNRFQYQLGIDRQNDGDFLVESNGVKILVDRGSAKRADGVTLDFEGGSGGGVLIDNPNEPAQVRQLDVRSLAAMLEGGRELRLIDVRTQQERDTADLSPKAELLDAEKGAELEALPKDTPLVFFCHHGGRSARVAQHFSELGFRRVFNLQGGIDAWSMFVDSSVPRY
jgi:monothiol glutaredoxin